MLGQIRDLQFAPPAIPEIDPPAIEADPGPVDDAHSPFTTFSWGGRLGRYVPQNFVFPTANVFTMWSLWYFGNRLLRVHPYRRLADGHQDDLTTHHQRVNLNRARLVMQALETYGVEEGFIVPPAAQFIVQCGVAEATNLLNRFYDAFIMHHYRRRTLRPRDIAINSVANEIYRSAKRARIELEADGAAQN